MECRLNCRFELKSAGGDPAFYNEALESLLEDLGKRIGVDEATTNVIRLVATDGMLEVCKMRLAFPFAGVTCVELFQSSHLCVTIVLACDGKFAVESVHDEAVLAVREMCQRYQMDFEELFAKER